MEKEISEYIQVIYEDENPLAERLEDNIMPAVLVISSGAGIYAGIKAMEFINYLGGLQYDISDPAKLAPTILTAVSMGAFACLLGIGAGSDIKRWYEGNIIPRFSDHHFFERYRPFLR